MVGVFADIDGKWVGYFVDVCVGYFVGDCGGKNVECFVGNGDWLNVGILCL